MNVIKKTKIDNHHIQATSHSRRAICVHGDQYAPPGKRCDRRGTETYVSLDRSRYDLGGTSDSGLVVKSGFLEIAIPFNDLISVTRTEKTVVSWLEL